jgi:hypothetical protein
MSDDAKQRILSYLADRPRAMDTVEGIALYWVEAEVEDVRRALTELVDEGRLVAYRQAGQVYYRATAPGSVRPDRGVGGG